MAPGLFFFGRALTLAVGGRAHVPLPEPFLLPSVDYETFDILEDEEVRQFSFLPGGWCERG